MTMEKTTVLNLLDELLEILELHVRNALNLCLCGGMATILDIIFNNPHEDARREACGIFSFTNQNNVDVQKITGKLGALNLLHQYVRETNVKNREYVMSALSSYLRGINTDGKREFLSDAYSGLAFLKAALIQSLGQVRLAKKIMMLLQDLVTNDSLILLKGNPNRIKLMILED